MLRSVCVRLEGTVSGGDGGGGGDNDDDNDNVEEEHQQYKDAHLPP